MEITIIVKKSWRSPGGRAKVAKQRGGIPELRGV
jgi:hypothetical protein